MNDDDVTDRPGQPKCLEGRAQTSRAVHANVHQCCVRDHVELHLPLDVHHAAKPVDGPSPPRVTFMVEISPCETNIHHLIDCFVVTSPLSTYRTPIVSEFVAEERRHYEETRYQKNRMSAP